MADENRLVDADVIADYLGVERKVILRLARRRLIPAIRIFRKIIRFDLHSVRQELSKLELEMQTGRRSIGRPA
jgi:hypothetical protein